MQYITTHSCNLYCFLQKEKRKEMWRHKEYSGCCFTTHSCVGKQKEFLFSCSFILSLPTQVNYFVFPAEEEKRILIYIVVWRKNFCAQEKYVVFRRSSNAKTKSNNSPKHYFARNKLVTNLAAECVKVHIQRCNGAYKLSQLQYIATQLLYTTQCPSFRIFPASAYH